MLFLLQAKASVTPVPTLMCDTFMKRSKCQEAKAEHEKADHGFISAGLFLTIVLWRHCCRLKVLKKSVVANSVMQLVPHPPTQGDLIEHLFSWPFLAVEIDVFDFFSKVMLL